MQFIRADMKDDVYWIKIRSTICLVEPSLSWHGLLLQFCESIADGVIVLVCILLE